MSWWNPSTWFNSAKYEYVAGNHTYTLTDPSTAALFTSAFRGGYAAESYINAALAVPEFFAVQDAITSRIMNGKFYVRRKSDGKDITDLRPHLKRLLEQPNPLQKGDDFRYAMAFYKIVAGNRYTYKKTSRLLADDYTGVQTLWQLRPQVTNIKLKSPRPEIFSITSTSDLIDKYLTSEDGRQIQIDPEFVLHDSDLGFSVDGELIKCTAATRAMEYPISNLCAVYEARNVIYVKGGPRVAIVSKKADSLIGSVALTPSEKKEVLDDLHKGYGLQHGKSPIAITGTPVDSIKIGANIAELLPFEETRACMYAIAAVQGVPKSVLPGEKGVTFSNAKEEEKGLYINRVIPEAQEICDVYNKILGLENEAFEIAVSFEHMEVLQADRLKQAQASKTETDTALIRYRAGMITKNKCREEMGEDKVTGEDYYYIDDPQRIENEQQNNGAAAQGRTD